MINAKETKESRGRIVFIGSQSFADFYGVGGMQSYIRRLGFELARRDYKVDYLVYGTQQEQEIIPVHGIRVKHLCSLADALTEFSSGNYSDIVRVWMTRRERLKFARYILSTRVLSSKGTSWKIHSIWFIVPDLLCKRLLTMLEGLIISRRGRLFCVSHRQWRMIRKWTHKACLLLPPVPKEFFLQPGEKSFRWPLKVTFLGVLHPDKGIEEVIELFTRLRGNPRFDCSIYAMFNPKVPAQVRLHELLLGQRGLKYVSMEQRKWSVELEKWVQRVLAETDIFVHPLKSLQNTVDTPLLLLEAMASLCAVLTTPIGSIPEIYGKESPFLIPHSNFVERAAAFLKGLSKEDLLKERMRIYRRNKELGFSQAEVTDRFESACCQSMFKNRVCSKAY